MFEFVTYGDIMKLLSRYIEYQIKLYPEIINWKNHLIGDKLSYSARDTVYDSITYPSNLHYHDYYELVILEEGNIRYICEGRIYHPKYSDIIVIPPGKFHMSSIGCESTRYKRHVFYFYPSAFDDIGHSALANFLTCVKEGELLAFDSLEAKIQLMDTLDRLANISDNEPSALDDALRLSYIIQVFYLLNQKSCRPASSTASLPEGILNLQKYIDLNYHRITSVSEIAKHFFYSREYISRLFRKHFDTTISNYITKRRIAKSQELIAEGLPITEIAYQVGFSSLPTFIRAFRSITNMTPSEYRKLLRENLGKN